jgi:outer membrane lipoprotein-sorting protein
MKSKTLLAASALVLSVVSASHAKTADELTSSGSADQKGAGIAAELGARGAGYKDLVGDVEMTLRDAGGSEATRRFRVKVLEKPAADVGDQSLIVFDAPADVKGTAVLSHAKPTGEDEQWLYLPSGKRTKRIASGNRTGSFVGSEFTFEDLTGNDGRKYAWKLLGQKACGTAPSCFDLEATPKDASSAYSKRVLHVETGEMRIQSIDFYDRRGTLAKTLAYDDYKKVDGRFWRAQIWTMKNVQSGKSTVIKFTSMKLGTGLGASDFAPSKLGG